MVSTSFASSTSTGPTRSAGSRVDAALLSFPREGISGSRCQLMSPYGDRFGGVSEMSSV
jgi:hypothetical protein